MSPSGRIWLLTREPSGASPLASRSKPGFASDIRAWSRSRSERSPQVRQTTSARLPCSSVTSRLPAAWCSPSTFWVMTGPSTPRRWRSATAWCAAFGSAWLNRCQPMNERAQ